MEKINTERMSSRYEIARVGKSLVTIAMKKVREGGTHYKPRFHQVAIFLKDNRYIRLTDAYVSKIGNELLSVGDLSNGLILESFNAYKGQVIGSELRLGLPRSTEESDFTNLRGVTSYANLGIMTAIAEELKTAKIISEVEFQSAQREFLRFQRRLNGRYV